jgi:hypothetical protein
MRTYLDGTLDFIPKEKKREKDFQIVSSGFFPWKNKTKNSKDNTVHFQCRRVLFLELALLILKNKRIIIIILTSQYHHNVDLCRM